MVYKEAVLQRNSGDCGVACMVWMARNSGVKATYGEALELVAPNRNGASLLAIKQALKAYGVGSTAYRCADLVSALKVAPALAAWNEDHYVILVDYKPSGQMVKIMDPAKGMEWISLSEAEGRFRGSILCSNKTEMRGRDGNRPKIDQTHGRTSTGKMGFVRLMLKGVGGRIATILALSAVVALIGALPSFLIGNVINGINESSFNGETVRVVSYQILVIAIAYFGISVLLGIMRNRLDRTLEANLGRKLGLSMLNLPLESVRRLGVGQTLVKFQSMYVVRDAISGKLLPMIGDVVYSLVTLSMLFSVSALHAIAVLSVSILLGIVLISTSKRAIRLSQDVIDCSGSAHGVLTESVINLAAVKTAGLEDERAALWVRKYNKSISAIQKRRNLDVFLESIVGAFSIVFPMTWLVFSLILILMGGSLEIGQIVTLISLCGFAIAPLQRIVTSVQGLLGVSAEFENVQDLLRLKSEEINCNGISRTVNTDICVTDLTLRADSGEVLVKDMTIDFPPNSFTAIIGSSGIGKTTFMRSVIGMYPEALQSISIGGKSLSSYNLRALRRQIGFLSQNPMIFTGSLRDNVVMGRNGISDEEVRDALSLAGLDDLISDLPLGISTQVTSDGSGLSGGQAQRLCLARALVTQPSILLLDEPTANLDVESEQNIFETLSKIEATIIVVTHEPDVSKFADQVIELTDAGFATPAEDGIVK